MFKLEGILAETSKLLGLASRLEDEKILGCWSSILEEGQQKNSKALSFKRGVLYVGTTSPSWAHHMTINKKNLIEEINKTSEKKVKDIRFSSTGSISRDDSKNE